MTQFASFFVSIGLISSKTNLWEKMLAWGRKMLNEIHHRKLQFWYYSQQVIFYINFKQISTLFFCYFFPFVWSLSLQRNKVREGVAVPRFNASWVFHQHEKVADYFWLLWLLLKWCSCPSMVTVHVIFFFFLPVHVLTFKLLVFVWMGCSFDFLQLFSESLFELL